MIRTARFITRVHTAPGLSYGTHGRRTQPGQQYEIVRSRVISGRTWYRLAEGGWVVRDANGVMNFWEDRDNVV